MTEKETSFYRNLFLKLKNKNKDIIDTKTAAIFMKKSNLSQEILKTIWSISSNSKNGLHEEEFYISLRLIALAQNDFPFTEEEIENNSPIPPLPKFENIIPRPSISGNNDEDDDSAYIIPHNNLILYKQYFENNKDSQLYYISTKKAIEMWIRNDNKKFNIDKVANSLKPLEKKGYLNLKEFQVACHLLSICNHHDIPIPLPNCLLKFLGRPLISNRTRNEYNKINNNEIHSNSNNCIQGYNEKIHKFNSEEINQKSNENLEDIKEFINDNRSNDQINYNKNMENSQDNVEQKKENNIEKINNENMRSSYKINLPDNANNFEINKFENSDNNNHEIINNDDLSKIIKRLEILEKNNDININNKKNNDALLKKIDELEEKNKEANIKISSLESEVDNLKKEKNKMSKELNQLKLMLQNMKTKFDSFNQQKQHNPFKAENTINQRERFKTLNNENSKKELKNNLELINNEQYNNMIPRNTLENNEINNLNNNGIIFNNNKRIPLDDKKRNNSNK